MNRTNKEYLVLAMLGLLQIGFTSCEHESERKPPNVLFIIVDDLNDYTGAFGGHPQVKTPEMDKLAASGISFTNAHCNAPICVPSRNSLFTGVYPHNSRDFGWEKVFEQPTLKNNKTLFELFRENGYKIMGSGKLLHFNNMDYWDEWGVDINDYGPFAFNGKETVGHPSVPEPFRGIGAVNGGFAPLSDVPTFHDSISGGNKTGWAYRGGDDKFLDYVDEDNRDLMPDELHAQWAAKRIQEMDDAKFDQPFFMGIGFVRPHTPLYAPKRFFDMYPVEDLELTDILVDDAADTHYASVYSKDFHHSRNKGPKYYKYIKESYDGDAELGLKHFLQAYLACISFVDEQIGLVVDAIDKSRFRDNTIIVFVSDHGWQMGEKDYLFKNSLWEESTRIPYIIRTPDIIKAAKVDHPVSLIDIYPTLVDLCGLKGDNRKNESGAKLDGFSVKPFLENPETNEWKGPDGVLTMLGNGLHQKGVFDQSYTLRTKDWRYILYLDGSEELYHDKIDPYEWENLASNPEYRNKKAELKNSLMERIKK
ncbi:MAG: sulfatase [Bacteroidota bacterium]